MAKERWLEEWPDFTELGRRLSDADDPEDAKMRELNKRWIKYVRAALNKARQ